MPGASLAEKLKNQVVELRRQVVARDTEVARLRSAQQSGELQEANAVFAAEVTRLRGLLQVSNPHSTVEVGAWWVGEPLC